MSTKTEIDEGLYSRQLYVIGLSAMQKMSQAKVLLSGLGPLGGEVAKNLVLTGLQNLFLHDLQKSGDISSGDISRFQIFLDHSDGNRAKASLAKLRALNPAVNLTALEEPLTLDDLKEFNLVVLALDGSDNYSGLNDSLNLEQVTRFCHENGIHLVLGEIRGLFFRVFCDFGEKFGVTEPDEVEQGKVTVTSVTVEKESVVTCLVDKTHGFRVGDRIRFVGVKNMEALGTRVVTRFDSATSFSVGDTTEFSKNGTGGTAEKEKVPTILKFKQYSDAITNPTFISTDFRKDPVQVHLAFVTLYKFYERNGQFPKSGMNEDTEKFLQLAESICQKNQKLYKSVDERLLTQFCSTYSANVPPMSFVGGIIAQEVIKGCTGRFVPLQNWLVGDFRELLIGEALQSTIFDSNLQEKLSNLKVFVVGAGAIGCEVLKNLALMGVGSGPLGKITVTDMDSIERSNLSRQFLFRSSDIGKPKSTTAAEAIRKFSPSIKIVPLILEVGHAHEERVFTSDFFEELDVVITALDNLAARKYMDEKCVEYKIPLLESGTQGARGSTQVVVPNLTKCYQDNRIPLPEVHAKCTLTFFPYKIEHTIQWARDKFEEIFTLGPNVAIKALKSGSLHKNDREQVYHLKLFIEHGVPSTYEDCVRWAHLKFHEFFISDIISLTNHFPEDALTEAGLPYWVGTKRFPKPYSIGTSDAQGSENGYQRFVTSGAKLYAEVFGIPKPQEEESSGFGNENMVQKMMEESLFGSIDMKGLNIKKISDANNDDAAVGEAMDDTDIEKTLDKFAALSDQLKKMCLTPLSFEKDDDTNFHVDFISAASNLRAANYGIDPVDTFTTKRISGKIIPAISTTTSLVSGLICIELYKLFDAGGREDITRFKDCFVSLANPQLLFVPPSKAVVTLDGAGREWSIWKHPTVQGDISMGQLFQRLDQDYGIEVGNVAYGDWCLYYSSMSKNERDEIMEEKVIKVIEDVSGEKVNQNGCKFIKLHVLSQAKIHENVSIPPIKYLLSEE